MWPVRLTADPLCGYPELLTGPTPPRRTVCAPKWLPFMIPQTELIHASPAAAAGPESIAVGNAQNVEMPDMIPATAPASTAMPSTGGRF